MSAKQVKEDESERSWQLAIQEASEYNATTARRRSIENQARKVQVENAES